MKSLVDELAVELQARATPDDVTVTRGTLRSAAESQARENFSPTALPIDPPMNEKSITASSTG